MSGMRTREAAGLSATVRYGTALAYVPPRNPFLNFQEDTMRIKPILGILFALAIAPGTALAQSSDHDKDKDDNAATNPSAPPASTNADVETGEPLPPSQSTDEAPPPVASPGAPAGLLVKQAGI